jgi:Ca2+-binding EF-hand superfamily protein
VRRQIDGATADAIPERERLAFRRSEMKRLKADREWTERKDKTRRKLRKAEEEQELSSVRGLSTAPQTFVHVDLPTGKRIYVPLEPGQDASSLKNCSLDAINATRRSGGVKAAGDAAKAAEGARRKRKAQMKMRAAVRMGAGAGPARPRSLPALLAPGATGHAIGCECALCERFQDLNVSDLSGREYNKEETSASTALVVAGSEGDQRQAESRTTADMVDELLTKSIDGAIWDVVQSSDARSGDLNRTDDRLRQIFDRADRNGDGKLSRAELILRLRRDVDLADLLNLPARISDEDRGTFERVFQTMDTDDSRGVDVEEFVAHLSRAVLLESERPRLSQGSQSQKPVPKLINGAHTPDAHATGRGKKAVHILGTTNEMTT